MFTGIVECVGAVRGVKQIKGGLRFEVESPADIDDLKIGDSISINGVCQTVVELDSDGFQVEAVGETLEKTTMQSFNIDLVVNLERPLTASSRVGGHFVQGHVNGVGTVEIWQPRGENYYLEVLLPSSLLRYVILEGSIAIDGISLTVARLQENRVGINIIPHTAKATNLKDCKPGRQVNIEVDMMAKYVERFMASQGERFTESH